MVKFRDARLSMLLFFFTSNLVVCRLVIGTCELAGLWLSLNNMAGAHELQRLNMEDVREEEG